MFKRKNDMDNVTYKWMYVCPTGCGNFVCYRNKADVPEAGEICMACGADKEDWIQHKAKIVASLGGCRKRPGNKYFSVDTGELLATYTQPRYIVGDF